MPTFDELDRLSSRELHERAFRRAKRHLDVRFFWTLLLLTPAAAVAAGDAGEAETEVLHWSAPARDAVKKEDDGALDGRRAFHLEYLARRA